MNTVTAGTVVVLHPAAGPAAATHERAAREAMAERIARLKGYCYGGEYDPTTRYDGAIYFVPGTTLLAAEAAQLGIHSVDNLFGGVVGAAVAATKCITHPLVDAAAVAPAGWCAAFADAVRPAVLEGFAVFDRGAAERAGAQLLGADAVRFKPGDGVGGAGQKVIRDDAELATVLAGLDEAVLTGQGAVLERHLEQAVTYSVGQVTLGDLRISYLGTQSTTARPLGGEVYGGSRLLVRRGDFADLLAALTDRSQRDVVEQALLYDRAAASELAEFMASRRNYDVVCGRDGTGQARCGVLEQSWRIGGASPAEIAALEAFAADPQRQQLWAEACERYGEVTPPADARVHFDGYDGRGNRLVKYSRVWGDADPA